MSNQDDTVKEILRYAQSRGLQKQDLLTALAADTNAATNTHLHPAAHAKKTTPNNKHNLNAATVLFYIGGLLLFTGIMVAIFQGSDVEDNYINYAVLTANLGFLSWGISYFLYRKAKNDPDSINYGVGDSLLLNGSLIFSVSAGLLMASFAEQTAGRTLVVIGSLLALTLAAMHYALDKLVKRSIAIVMVTLFGAAAYYSALTSVFYGASSHLLWATITILFGLYFVSVGRLFEHSKSDRQSFKKPYYSLGGFIIIATLYSLVVSGSIQVAMTLLFPSIIYAAFVYSIKSQSKTFLFTGSAFLVIYINTVIAKYFADGLGASFAFFVAAIAVIGSAIFTLQLKKKYFK